MSMLYLAI